MGIFNEHSTVSKNGQGFKQIRGPPGVGFKLTDNGDYDIQYKKIVNLANGTNSQDAINKSHLHNAIATIHTKGKDIDLED